MTGHARSDGDLSGDGAAAVDGRRVRPRSPLGEDGGRGTATGGNAATTPRFAPVFDAIEAWAAAAEWLDAPDAA